MRKSQKMFRLIKDPIYLGIIIGNLKGQSFPTSSSIRIFALKYTKEILKNTKEKSGIGIFQFLAIQRIFRISKMVGCIPEVLTLLLTPILKYICMSNARCHICQICHICHLCMVINAHHMYVCQYGCQKKC